MGQPAVDQAGREPIEKFGKMSRRISEFYSSHALSMSNAVRQCASICHLPQTAFGQAISWPFLTISKSNCSDGYERSGNLEQEGVR